MVKRDTGGLVNPAAEAAAERVLARAYAGIHHVEGWSRRRPWGDGLVVTVPGGLSTYDFDVLTRLVVAAHDECVRVQIEPGGPRQLRLAFHVRQREGSMFERHPTIEEAVVRARGGAHGWPAGVVQA